MEFFVEIIMEFVIGGFLSVPGAFIVWLLKGRKTKFSELLENNYWQSVIIGVLFWALLITIIIFLNK